MTTKTLYPPTATSGPESVSGWTRRQVLKSGGAASIAAFMPTAATAAADEVIATIYPGSWETAQREVMLPYLEDNCGCTVVMTPLLGVNQVAAITAAKSNPPYDVVTFDEGPFLASLHHDIVQPYPVDESAHFDELLPQFQNEWGPVISGQPVGIAYNTEVFDSPPTSWNDMWDDKYAGRVGLTGAQSSLGTAFLLEIAKLHGGSESNIDPGFQRIQELLPNVGTLAASPGALATLFQQGEVVIAPNYYNNIYALQEQGVPVGLALPESGAPFIRTSLHIVKNARATDLAFQFVEAAINPDVQAKLMAAPHVFIPTNRNVEIAGPIRRDLFSEWDEFEERFIFYDWNEINPRRADWIERFNREVSA